MAIPGEASGGPCPACGASMPVEPGMPVWCDHCRHGVEGSLDTRTRPWLSRTVSTLARAAAVRAHERLAADAQAWRRPPSRGLVLILSLVTIMLVLGLIVGLSWWGLGLPTPMNVAVVGFAGLLLWIVRPRPTPFPQSAVRVPGSEAAALHEYIATLAQRVGARPPQQIVVDATSNMYVTEVGWRRTRTLGIGLPLWSALDWSERTMIIGHELGHLRANDTGVAAVVLVDRRSLWSIIIALWPPSPNPTGELILDAANWIGFALQRLVALPAVGIGLAFEALNARHSQFQEYLADHQGALIVGPVAAARSLEALLPPVRGTTAMESAVPAGSDPWQAITNSPRPTPRELERRRLASALTEHQYDDTHPPTHLRIDLVSRVDEPMDDLSVLLPDLRRTAIDAEVERLRSALGPLLRDHVLRAWW